MNGVAISHEQSQGTSGPDTRPESKNRFTTVDVIIPVYNEERALPGCIEVLHSFLSSQFPFEWTITIVDNASTDSTAKVAADLAKATDRVRTLHLEEKGRGRALRTAWNWSDADIVAYMDVDLSTGLNALLPLIAPLVNGHSDIAVGSRLAPGARTVRGPKREFISRCYNAMIRLSHGTSFSDAQCGFKAARTEVIRQLLPHIADNAWFFDTELLLVAEHNNLRIHEVPVDWVEDTDSRVHVTTTALDDIRGLVRVAKARANGAATVVDLPRRAEPQPIHPHATVAEKNSGLLWQLISFGLIGVLSTVAYLGLYGLTRNWWPTLVANFVALTVTTLLNTEANRRFTFISVSGSPHRVHMQGLIVFALYYAFTSGTLLALNTFDPQASRLVELLVLLIASLAGTVGRFLLLRAWVFRNTIAKGQA